MGIAKFYGWFSHVEWFVKTISRDRPEDVDYFLIDLNQVIHPAAGEEMNVAAINVPGGYAVTSETIYSARYRTYAKIFENIVGLTRVVRPRRALVVAVDGVAPQAKLNQQRNRRYKNAASRKPEIVFDSNSITPGTQFMIDLDNYLQEEFRKVKELGMHADVFPPTIVYSSHLVPGEGEHKIADYLRGIPAAGRTAVIYGADADLIMIYSMILRQGWENIYLFRSSTHRSNPEALIKIREFQALVRVAPSPNLIATRLSDLEGAMLAKSKFNARAMEKFAELKLGVTVEKLQELETILSFTGRYFIDAMINLKSLRDVLVEKFAGVTSPVDDFVIIIFLIGNDFLPHFPVFERIHDALHTLIGGYALYLQENLGKDVGLSTGSNINWANLGAFLKFITVNYNNTLLKLWGENPDAIIKFPSALSEMCVKTATVIGQINACKRDMNVDQFNQLWYLALFSSKVSGVRSPPSPADISRLINHYLEGVAWIYSYYRHGVSNINTGWYYPYHYSPLFSDLYSHIEANPTAPWEIEPLQERSDFVSPLVQLTMVIPGKSIQSIPQQLWPLYTEASPIYDLFPETFVVDTQGKMEDWQSIAILPIPQVERVIMAVNSLNLPQAFVSFFDPKQNIFYERSLTVVQRGRGRGTFRGAPRGAPRGAFRGAPRGAPRGAFRGAFRGGRGGRGAPRRGRGVEVISTAGLL